jgi:hypothetical protein
MRPADNPAPPSTHGEAGFLALSKDAAAGHRLSLGRTMVRPGRATR